MPGGVNLIPQVKLLARRRMRRVRAWCVGGSIYGAALAAIWIGVTLFGQDEHAALATEIETLQKQIDQDNQAALALRPRLDAALASLAANRSVGDQPDWALLLSLIAQPLGDDAVLSACQLDSAATEKQGGDAGVLRRYTLRLQGLGRSHGTVLRYVGTLEDMRLFESVKLLETRPEPFGEEGAIGFKIECVVADRMKEAK